MDTSGRAVINPANSGFLPDSHEANAITNAAIVIFVAVKNMIGSFQSNPEA